MEFIPEECPSISIRLSPVAEDVVLVVGVEVVEVVVVFEVVMGVDVVELVFDVVDDVVVIRGVEDVVLVEVGAVCEVVIEVIFEVVRPVVVPPLLSQAENASAATSSKVVSKPNMLLFMRLLH
jgi:hypothetical protein